MPDDSAKARLSSDEPRRLLLEGYLSYEDAPIIRRMAGSLLDAGSAPLRVDVRALRFMDSSGLSALLNVANAAAHRGTYVCLIGPNAQLQHLLDVTGLGPLFHLEEAESPAPCDVTTPADLPPAEIALDLPCDPSALAMARDAMEALLAGHGLVRQDVDDIQLALGEAIANAVRHGCPGAPAGSGIRMRAACRRRELELEVTDAGPGFDPTGIPEPDVTRLADGGMGIFFMRRVMDEVTYVRDGRGNTVRMIKRFRTAGGPGPGRP